MLIQIQRHNTTLTLVVILMTSVSHYCYQNIEQTEDIIEFIYPVVKYIQATRRSKEISSHDFKSLVDNFSSAMTTKFGAAYEQVLKDTHSDYSALANSDDPLDQEKYHIFMEFFAAKSVEGN